MKITIQKAEEQKPESKYPYFGIHIDGTLVYFLRENYGTFITGKVSCATEGDSLGINESFFTPFIGTIKIEQ